jgi:hypothetical protein
MKDLTQLDGFPFLLERIEVRIIAPHEVKLKALRAVLPYLSVVLQSGTVNFSFPVTEILEPLFELKKEKPDA